MIRVVRLLVVGAALGLSACASLRPVTRYRDPLSPEEHLQLGLSYEKQNLAQEAEKEYRAAAGPRQRNVPGLIALGNLLSSENRLPEAERILRRAEKIAPDNAAVGNNLASVYLAEKKHLDRAEKLALKAAGDARLRPYALDTLANVYVDEKRLDDARAALEKARAAAPAGDPTFAAGLDKTAARLPPSVVSRPSPLPPSTP